MKLISDDSSMPLVVVACSGYTEDSEKTKCALIGMEEYLEKPLNNACLGKILDKYLWLIDITSSKNYLFNNFTEF